MSGKPDVLKKFFSKVEKQTVPAGDEGCWIWKGALRQGYGTFMPDARRIGGDRRVVYAHRWIYELHVEALDGRHVHHICGNRACVNPAHLEALSQIEHNALHPRERSERGTYVGTA